MTDAATRIYCGAWQRAGPTGGSAGDGTVLDEAQLQPHGSGGSARTAVARAVLKTGYKIGDEDGRNRSSRSPVLRAGAASALSRTHQSSNECWTVVRVRNCGCGPWTRIARAFASSATAPRPPDAGYFFSVKMSFWLPRHSILSEAVEQTSTAGFREIRLAAACRRRCGIPRCTSVTHPIGKSNLCPAR
jgi:hypothetical protein